MLYVNHRFMHTFSVDTVPEWVCPHCDKGSLELDSKRFHSDETPVSKNEHTDPDWEPDWMDYRFTCVFLCNFCEGETYACGTGHFVSWHPQDPEDEVLEEVRYTPKYFEPPIRLLKIPSECHVSVRKALMGSFAVAWADLSAGCNKLRVAVEKLVNDIEPELTGTLHQKIEKLEKSRPDASQLLMAIKWLGNEASHDDDLKEYDLAFGYKVMESVLEDIYQNNKKMLYELVAIVNSTKGSPVKT